MHILDDHTSLLAKGTRFRAAGTMPDLGFVCKGKSAMKASYRIALRIAKENKCHAIGERLVKPCSTDTVQLVCEREQKKKLRKFLCQTIQYVVV